jgi:lipoate-protein ligase A
MSANNENGPSPQRTVWRVIEYAEYDAFMNMAIDEALSESVAGSKEPTIRFYGWRPAAVSIGYFQSLEKEVDLEACRAAGVDIVRRRTGGGAVYHDSEITYSVIAPEPLFPRDIIASYQVICGWIVDSLSQIGIKSEFRPINDIIVSGKKISGNAQSRRGGILLQHGTILYSVDVERMFSLLKVSDEKIRDKMIANVKDRVTSVSELTGTSKAELYRALLAGFTTGKHFNYHPLLKRERLRAAEIADERYRSAAWSGMR